MIGEIVRPLFRKKQIDPDELGESQLRRCLTLVDLILLGLGKTLGAGVYVVTGQVAKHKAGPAMILSFLVAAVVATLSALCYAEFGARVPKAGSAYIYTYIAVGEAFAFVVGWSLFLQNCIGGASVARATSAYLDSLIDNRITNYMTAHFPMDHPGLADFPDFLALIFCLFFAFMMIFGVKESATFNNIFAGLNMYVIVYIIICGLFKIDGSNWSIPASDIPTEPCERIIGNETIDADCPIYGTGGFFPYGFNGVVAGAAMCFYAFIGFDVISQTGEEAQKPQRNIPLGTMLSLLIVFLAYFGVSAVLTLMLPYYSLDEAAPLPVAFDSVGWWFATYIVTLGGICGLITSLFGCIFAMPRYIYSMASDGLLYGCLGWVSERSKTPIIACLVCGTLSGVLGLMLDIEALVNIVAAGTLVPYALVAACVLILRYEPDGASAAAATILYPRFRIEESKKFTESSLKNILYNMFKPRYHVATGLSSTIVMICVCLLSSLFINIYLLLHMDKRTWIGYAGFMLIGLFIYITYGIKHSKERKTIAICEHEPLLIPNERKTPKQSLSNIDLEMNEEDDGGIKLTPDGAVYVNASTPAEYQA
ncbi:cationic amino acid transporter 2-like [Amphiura filiformis]|uniref:cationic amino acid transporter 2-like n=1 Tax=Amphiura filiformis TaxID=82378 RepID=UPI003B217F76